ncbi:MAG: adenine/guanine phosphoribosyltransferase-like PRPP-binding protein [Motiliproteus sp.]|jgi:adenine/guanine phosphoribosyltransferase-like PRPP-binding protein
MPFVTQSVTPTNGGLYAIEAGLLTISIVNARHPLFELLAFASRKNPKRGYLFVSKVLGKHLPVRPAKMRETYNELATLIDTGPATYVVGMAETATGLAAGVADSLSKLQIEPVIYQHTTRHEIDSPQWLTLDEAHSHAVDHILYEPFPGIKNEIAAAERLVLVDDEISTGRTLRLLAEKLSPRLAKLKEIVIVSLVSWLDDEKRKQFEQLGVPVRYISLLEGTFSFAPDPEYKVQLPGCVDKDSCGYGSDKLGRRAMRMPYKEALPAEQGEEPLTVVGNGEHLYIPFLVAEYEELKGRDVLFQSTTRSPIQPGGPIISSDSFSVDERPVRHFVYNLANQNRRVRVLLEDDLEYAHHELARRYSDQRTQEKLLDES